MRRSAILVLTALLAGAPVSVPARAQSIDAQIDQLTARVARLEGARAVRKLQRAFGYYVDRGLWTDAAGLFTDDGTIEIGADGVYAGKDRIREYLMRLHGGQEGLVYGQLNEWVTLQPAITVAADGMSATARWRDLGMLGQYKHHAEWRDGIYENTYVNDGGIWKLKSLHLYVNFVAPYERGWARLAPGEGLAQSEAARAFPPDRPPTSMYHPFPETQVPPFQARNPVTGRPVVAAR
ncbi:MAG: nuclear transport factor 2 family protein [Croceibacterium sp.]